MLFITDGLKRDLCACPFPHPWLGTRAHPSGSWGICLPSADLPSCSTLPSACSFENIVWLSPRVAILEFFPGQSVAALELGFYTNLLGASLPLFYSPTLAS